MAIVDDYAGAELDRVMRGNTVLTMPERALCGPLAGAGEWDWLRSTPRRVRRSLVAAGYLTRVGERPDVIADLICAEVPGVDTLDDALRWYVRTCVAAIAERRRAAHRERHQRFASYHGFATYYERRRALALEYGHGSVWHMRQDRGWR